MQIIGRATRDAPGKTRARFTNLIAEPDAAAATGDRSRQRHAEGNRREPADGAGARAALRIQAEERRATARRQVSITARAATIPKKCNVGFNEQTGQFQIEIKGLAEPKSPEASRICQQDLNEVIAAFVQDKTTIERGLFDEELVPEELTQVRMGQIIRDKYPSLEAEDQEAVRQHAIAALNLTQKAKQIAAGGNGGELSENTAFVDGVRRFVVHVRELDIDLIDRINPFGEAFEILAKSMDEERLKQVEAAIAAKRATFTLDEAKDYALRARQFKKERGRLPNAEFAGRFGSG